MEFVSGDQYVQYNVFDVADKSNVSGVTVEYIWDYGNSNQSLGTAVTDAKVMRRSHGPRPHLHLVIMFSRCSLQMI